ncbi:MAG: hypothetical protein ACYDAL_17720 [Candidatus Dormibacteraceae bacterium]
MVAPDREVRSQDEIETKSGQLADDRAPRGPEALQNAVLNVQLQGDFRMGPEPVRVAERKAVFGRDRLAGGSEDAPPVQRHPRHIHRVGIGLDQDR